MSLNKHKPHLIVLPEDDANRQIANGFILNNNVNQRAIQVLSPAGGWKKTIDNFINNHISVMQQYPQRSMVLLMDFDRRDNRFEYVKNQIPEHLAERVFILGVQSNPEKLRRNLEINFEDIGESLAVDCVESNNQFWGQELLEHNQPELERMIKSIKPYLFNL
jgi:hypothetical protein